ncbi:MAG: TIGR02680 family protein [Acidimicrobiales bacterium]
MIAAATTTIPIDEADERHQPPRWRLHRAGIVNVYQYENEVLHFAGGRLLLRGVNGSGKSTAMNMLLPFLVTARLGRIDAAGEQSGMLKSWMLNGRDDPQPVGYLWIEFERGGDHLVMGCGIKASRSTDSVSTWWFLTTKRPGIDISLIENGVPLSADALRTVLDGDEVFGHDRRRAYRAAVERVLFAGASIDQHIGLINVVRNPRVGDRIDVDLPEHLVAALPRLSEQALAEAAQPLDDLEEHRRNVAELARTADAVAGLLDVYRAYARTEARRHIDEGNARVKAVRAGTQTATRLARAAEAAAEEVAACDRTIADLDAGVVRLRREIAALEESQAYRDGQQLEALRDLVANLAAQHGDAEKAATAAGERVRLAVDAVDTATRRADDDTETLGGRLVALARLTETSGVRARPPGAPRIERRELDGLGVFGPAEAFASDDTRRGLDAVVAGCRERRVDVADTLERRTACDLAERNLADAESERARAEAAAEAARARAEESRRVLLDARQAWQTALTGWATQARPSLMERSQPAPTIAQWATPVGDTDASPEAATDHRAVSEAVRAEIDQLVETVVSALAAVDGRLSEARTTLAEAEAHAAELATRTEPASPRLAWQRVDEEPVFADLVDFAPDLDDAQRAGLEAALEASGLLSARLVGDTGFELSSGDLVVRAAGGVAQPLSTLLVATVPDALADRLDAGTITGLLQSIGTDLAVAAETAVCTDGSFRIGALAGRHAKDRAEHVGATARRAALERARAEAAAAVAAAAGTVAALEDDRRREQAALDQARSLRSSLPSTAAIDTALARLDAATAASDDAAGRLADATEAVAAADRAAVDASNELHRVATTLMLPTDRAALDAVARDLDEAAVSVERALSGVDALERSVMAWQDAAGRARSAASERVEADARVAATGADLHEQQVRLATLEDSIGLEYREVVAARDQSRVELADNEARLPDARAERDAAVARRAAADADARVAAEARDDAERRCDETLATWRAVYATPGFLDAVADIDGEDRTDPSAVATAGSVGLTQAIAAAVALLEGPAVPEGPAVAAPESATTADGVRLSLRARRDALGAGWDAEAWQPDPALPLRIEVNGPSGKATLTASARAVATQYQQLSSLLDRKQDDALRELLQGLIAREVAEKVNGAERLVQLMNDRLGGVTTSHQVGVRLRWRRSPELEPDEARMVELLSRLPDLRTDDDERELRQALSNQLDEARRLAPDVPYRQLIAETLDYTQWHEMAVMLRRGTDPETRLGRSTPLSEGEKKLVTYLPLFAAVAASYDALAEASTAGDRDGIARFVLLDDAFAKVSEDNHAGLFGLLVDLDLDLIATSERLWGTHASVPALAITEVVRDVTLGVILLEHYRWDGHTLERR